MNKKVLVIGNMNKYRQAVLDKMQENGYEIVYEDGSKINGLEFDFIFVDELITEGKFIQEFLE
ncbi:hypothetical protein D3C85_1455190 [compost metagenome]